jgi:quercetin dioxygenase-like cupin family protein
MAFGRKKLTLLLGSTLALGFAAGVAVGQMKAPTADKGLSADKLEAIDTLRMRKVMLLPNGVIGLHSHKDQPTVNYLLQGVITFHQEGKPPVVVKAGESFAEGRATTHWAENRTGVAAVWIAVDIPKQP